MKKQLFLGLLLCLTANLFAQDAPTWSHKFDHRISWYNYDAKTSIYYLYDGKNLHAFDCLTQSELWEVEVDGLLGENFRKSEQYPFVWLDQLPSAKRKIKLKLNTFGPSRYMLLNTITGEVLLDSDNYEMEKVQDRYVLYDQGIVLLFGKHKKKRVIGMAEFGASKMSWMIDNPAILKKITLNNDVKEFPEANKDYVLIRYGNDVFSIDRKTGEIVWQKNTKKIEYSNVLLKRYYLRTDDPNCYLITGNEENYQVMATDLATGKARWSKPLNTGEYYNVTGRENDFFVRTNNYFDFVNYKSGKRKINKNLPIKGNLDKVYLQKDGYLITSRPKRGKVTHRSKFITIREPSTAPQEMTVDWLDLNLKKKWAKSPVLAGAVIDRVEKLDNRILALTNAELAVIDLKTGKVLSRESISRSPLLDYNLATNSLMYFDTLTYGLHKIDLASGQKTTIEKRVKFKHKKRNFDFPNSLNSVGDKYALMGSRNLWLLDEKGAIVYQKYYPEKLAFNWKKAVGTLIGVTVGILFQDELHQLNYELFKEGLIAPEDFWNNSWAMGNFGKYGSSAVATDYMDRIIPEKERISASEFFEDTWILTDKLDGGKFGVRLIDIATGEEEQSIWLAKNDEYSIKIDFRQLGLYKWKGNTLNFYKF